MRTKTYANHAVSRLTETQRRIGSLIIGSSVDELSIGTPFKPRIGYPLGYEGSAHAKQFASHNSDSSLRCLAYAHRRRLA